MYQYAQCLRDNIQRGHPNLNNISIHMDVWCSLNKRSVSVISIFKQGIQTNLESITHISYHKYFYKHSILNNFWANTLTVKLKTTMYKQFETNKKLKLDISKLNSILIY